jgi:formamidopyrimidine-DNA glycosylase
MAMPELPELQAHAERFNERYRGSRLERFRPLSFTVMKTAVPSPDAAHGHTLSEFTRVGKYLIAHFGGASFAIHLMQGGRLIEDTKQAAKPRGGLARWVFDDGRAWLLTEQAREHRAGIWTDPAVATSGLGPDASSITIDQLIEGFSARNQRIHGFLRNQGCVAGIGRRLANEVCHTARLSPFAMTGKLGAAGAERIAAAIREAIGEGLAYERTRSDMSSSADRPGQVHRREGELCPVCGDVVRTVSYSNYTVFYCATCQTDRKPLADNTTSKFLK